MLGPVTGFAEFLANHRLTRLVFVASLALLPLALFALVAERAWLFLVATGLCAVTDGILRLAPLSRGRLLRVVRDRATQTSSVRIGLIAVAFLWLTDNNAATAIISAGLIASVLCRVGAGWIQHYATRAGRAAVGEPTESEIDRWLARGSVAARYSRGLTITELTLLGALAVALAGGSDAWVLGIVAAAWLPSLELFVMTTVRWISTVRQADVIPADRSAAGRVAAYFAEPVARSYQLQQWLPVLAEIHRELGVQLIFRDRRSFDLFGELTDLPRYYARTLHDLTDLYTGSDHAVVLYVNNGWRNFQSLSWPRALHVHINHGESDKTSLVTHQVRAYDRVLVAGDAAIRRMAVGLLEVELSSVVVVGRPQLDYVDVGDAATHDTRPTLVYAPTWEGENGANNFSSIDIAGPDIVRALLEIPGATVVYKPHPRTPRSPDRQMREAHKVIEKRLEEAAAIDPAAGHGTWGTDILPLLARADLLVADVSSVAVDHLYLRPDAGLILMDRGSGGGDVRVSEIPVARAATVVGADRLGELREIVFRLLTRESQFETRTEVRREYFGDFDVGESTRRFQSVVRDLVDHRDRTVASNGMSSSVSLKSRW